MAPRITSSDTGQESDDGEPLPDRPDDDPPRDDVASPDEDAPRDEGSLPDEDPLPADSEPPPEDDSPAFEAAFVSPLDEPVSAEAFFLYSSDR